MKKQKFVCALFAFFMFLSCSDEDASVVGYINSIDNGENESSLTEQEAKVLYRMREPDNRVTMDEVTKLANEAISILNGENGESLLKSGSARRISSISALVSESKPALKSSVSSDFGDIAIPDTLAYILNFNDSLGFAIVSADTRIDNPLLAFTDNGSLIDSTDNPGIAIFLERLEDYMLNSIIEAEEQKDSLLDGIMGKIGDEAETKAANDMGLAIFVTETPWSKLSQVTPLVPVEWGQGSPFSDNVGGNCNNTH